MNWSQVQLQEIVLQEKGAFVSGPFGSSISAKYFVEEGVPVIRGNNLTKGKEKFLDDGFVYLTESKAREFQRCIAVKDDIVFTAAGSIGQVGIIPRNSRFDEYVISNKQLRARIDPNRALPMFVYFWLSSKRMIRWLENMNNGGAVPLLNLGIVKRTPIPVPPLEKQEKIVDLMSNYDDLIENNKRRIELLEESARQLYKEWFVRFRFPGHEHVKIVDGVPEGWDKKQLREVLTLNYGKALKAEIRISGDIPVYGSSGQVGTHNKALVKGPGIVVGRKGNVGSIFWVHSDFFPIDTVYFVTTEESDYFTYYALLHTTFVNTDVAVPGLNRDMAYSREILIPSDILRQEFLDEVTPVFEQCNVLSKYNKQLSTARDLLVPKLMSGEIAV